jgi:menaquinone-specific isochorismate synthase
MSSWPASAVRHAARLVAYTESIADPEDLLRRLGAGGGAWLVGESGFVTAGVAARFTLGEACAALAAIEHRRSADAPESAGPRAIGALRFEGGGTLVLPARIVARDGEGRAWQTTVAGVDVPPPLHLSRARPTSFTVRSAIDVDEWRSRLQRALAAIGAGALEKVVLSRTVDVEADASFDAVDVLDTLRATQPGCTVYGIEGFVGASPELLVRRRGRAVESRPMAGTGDDPAALLASAKDAREHRIVVDAIVETLSTLCEPVTFDGPSAVRFATVTHLASEIRGRLRDERLPVTELVARLHPTPAVSGWPDGPAQTLIRELEGRERGRYAGALGWVDAAGDGEFVVALRCAQLAGNRARLHAGAGIVAGSEPAAEWAETQAKLQPMLRALVRP